jgi:glycosyltransferase involved in cell wall biosynthesis
MSVNNRRVNLVSVIIPAYNEEKTIKEVIERVKKVDFRGLPKEIIVVDDCSTDNTASILNSIDNITVISHSQNQGKGAAIRTGLKYAKGDVVIIQDADLEYDPVFMPLLLDPILNGQADAVFGSRFKGKVKGMHLSNRLANRLLTSLTNILYDAKLTDMETCYKMFKKSLLDGVKLKANKFDVEVEITARLIRSGCRILEVPIEYNARSAKEGKKIGWKDGLEAILALIKYRYIS